jgi:hypothetical protein
MFADLVYRLEEGMKVRIFKNKSDTAKYCPDYLLSFDLTAEQITELVAVQGIKPRQIDSNGEYVRTTT